MPRRLWRWAHGEVHRRTVHLPSEVQAMLWAAASGVIFCVMNALVRQLLAFGRRQALQPRPLAINAVISNISDLLRRLIGEKVRLELELESPGRTVRADPTQLDQVLVNLAVNENKCSASKYFDRFFRWNPSDCCSFDLCQCENKHPREREKPNTQ